MGNLWKSLLEMHFKDQISKMITLTGNLRKLATFKPKSKEIITRKSLLTKISKNLCFKQEI